MSARTTKTISYQELNCQERPIVFFHVSAHAWIDFSEKFYSRSEQAFPLIFAYISFQPCHISCYILQRIFSHTQRWGRWCQTKFLYCRRQLVFSCLSWRQLQNLAKTSVSKFGPNLQQRVWLNSAAVSIFVVILVELTNCQFNQHNYKYWDGSAVYD